MECWRLRLRGANIGGNVILKLPKAGHTTLDELKDLVAESVQQGLDSLVIKAGFPPKELSSDGGPDAIISKLGVADAETLIVDWPAGTGAGEMTRGSGAAEVVGRSEGRSRKPQKVVKMVSGQSSSGRPQPAATSAQQQQARSQEPASATETLPGQKRAPAQAPAKSQKKPKASSSKSAPTQRTGLEFESASSAFDPADVAGAFMRNDFGEGRDSLGEVAFDQFASAARLHALETGKVEVKEEQEEGALKLVVEYSGNNKKVRSEFKRSGRALSSANERCVLASTCAL